MLPLVLDSATAFGVLCSVVRLPLQPGMAAHTVGELVVSREQQLGQQLTQLQPVDELPFTTSQGRKGAMADHAPSTSSVMLGFSPLISIGCSCCRT